MSFAKKYNKNQLLGAGSTGFELWMNSVLTPLKSQFSLDDVRIRGNSGTQCYTDGNNITIGFFNPFFVGVETAEEMCSMALGLIFHEFGHILYTPFSSTKMTADFLKSGSMWPEKPANYPESLGEYTAKGRKEQLRVATFYHHLHNALEDGREEMIMLTEQSLYAGFCDGLSRLRNYQFENLTASVKESVDSYESAPDEMKPYIEMENAIDVVFQLAKYGTLKGFNDLAAYPQVHDIVRRVNPYVNDFLDAATASEMFHALNCIFCEIFEDFILPYLETINDDKDSTISEPDGTDASSEVKDVLDKIAKKNGLNSVSPSSPDPETEKKTESVKKDYEETKSEQREKRKDESSEKSAAEKGKDSSEGASAPESSAAKDAGGKKSSGPESESTLERSASDPGSDSDGSGGSGIEVVETGSLWNSSDGPGSVTKVDIGLEPIKGIDLNTILGPSTDTDNGSDETYEKLKDISDIDFGDMNRNLDWNIVRCSHVENRESEYNLFRDYIDIGKNAARRLKPYFDPTRKAFYEKDRYSGSRIVAGRLSNPNLRHFAKKSSTPASPSLSVAILVDESGSMQGKKEQFARAAAISLYEMCKELDIRFGVFGHSWRRSKVHMVNYCYFDDKKEDDKYRLLQIAAHGSNRDGAALRYTSEFLAKEDSSRKLLIVISDGQPAAPGYGGKDAERDIQNVIKDFERNGIKYIAAAIDADKENIRSIYGSERFLDITDLGTLPEKLVRVVRGCMA